MQNDNQIRKYSQKRKQRKRDCFVSLLVFFFLLVLKNNLTVEREMLAQKTNEYQNVVFLFFVKSRKNTLISLFQQIQEESAHLPFLWFFVADI